MQCPNCRFQNMPGSAACGRCGTSLALQAHAIDVHPPRARRWRRPKLGLIQGRNIVGNGVSSALDVLEPKAPAHDTSTFTLRVLARCLIPGWAQFYMHRPRRGYVFMIGAGIMALIAIMMVGTRIGTIALGLLFSLHAGSVCDAATPPGRTARESLSIGLAVYACLGLLVYLPIIRVAGWFATPYVVQQAIRPFEPGEVLLVRASPSPQRGQIVVFQRSEPVTLQLAGHAVLYINGLGIDRVLAIGGDRISCLKGTLLVNDSAVSYQPLNHPRLPDFDMTVPQGELFVWPSAAPQLTTLKDWQRAVLIPPSDVTGRVIWRTYPWTRFGSVQ